MIHLSVSGMYDLPSLARIRAVIGITDRGDALPEEVQRSANVLALKFHDAEGNDPQDVFPEPWHLEQASRFLIHLPASSHPLAIHICCFAGISRSTAMASFALAVLESALTDAQIMKRVLVARPQAVPNHLMLKQADKLLGRRLLRTWISQGGRYASGS